MERLHFEDYETFACFVADALDKIRQEDDFNDVSIIAKYEEVRHIMKELMCIGYDLHSVVDFYDEEFSGYSHEYVLSLCNITGEYELWLEPMLRNENYLVDDATVTFILDNCSSKVIPYCKAPVQFEVSFEEDYEEECCDCCECCSHCENDDKLPIESDGDMHGFSVSHSDENGTSHYSFYSTDMNLVEKMVQLFK